MIGTKDLAGAKEVGRQVLMVLTGDGAEDFDEVGTTKVRVPGLTLGTVSFLADACGCTRVDMRLRVISGDSYIIVSMFGARRPTTAACRQIRCQLSRRLAECLRASFGVH